MYFGGGKCKLVHEKISSFISNNMVFSICSDERISDDLECYLTTLDDHLIPDYIVVLGDFIENPPLSCPASSEVIRLLSRKSDKKIHMCWIDSAAVRLESLVDDDFKWEVVDLRFERARSGLATIKTTADTFVAQDLIIYNKLCLILCFSPEVKLDYDGNVVSISFLDGQVYPRSIIEHLSDEDIGAMWFLLSQFKMLRCLNLSFSRLRSLPEFFFGGVEKLDLRGNIGINLDNIFQFPNLRHLNISACGLVEIPNILKELIFLEVFLCYKNHIKNLSGVFLANSIVRISLYRNDIENIELDLSECGNISEVNIGANPVRRIKLGLRNKIINLRVRHINPDVILKISPSDLNLINISNY